MTDLLASNSTPVVNPYLSSLHTYQQVVKMRSLLIVLLNYPTTLITTGQVMILCCLVQTPTAQKSQQTDGSKPSMASV